MRWAVLSAPDASKDPGLRGELNELSVDVMVDTESWRWADRRTWDAPKWASLPTKPASCFDGTDKWVRDYVRSDLLFQANLGVGAYLLPAWFPHPKGSAADTIEQVTEAGLGLVGSEVEVKPVVGGLALRRDGLHQCAELGGRLHGALSAAYVLLSPWDPAHDPVDRLSSAARVLLGIEDAGIQVVVGRGGGIGVALRGLGLSAAEAGLAEGEAFDQASAVASSLPRQPAAGDEDKK